MAIFNMKALEEAAKLLKKNRDKISSEYKARVLGVFGSYAREGQKPETDIDILVRFDVGATLFDLVGLGDFLEEMLCLKVDIVSERALRPELRDRMLAEAAEV